MAVAAMIAAALFLIPTSISVLGFSGSCGAPVLGAFVDTHSQGEFAQPFLAQCRNQSITRLIAGVGVGTVGCAGGGAMLAGGIAASRRRARVPGWVAPHGYAAGPARQPGEGRNDGSW